MSELRLTPRAITLIVAGIIAFLLGLGLLTLGRVLPAGSTQMPGIHWAVVAAITVGGCLLAGGVGIGVLGWNSPTQHAGAPPGSHRGVLATTALALVASLGIAVVALTVVPGASARTATGFLFLALSVDVVLIALCYAQGVRTGIITRDTLGLRWEQVERGLGWGIGGALLLLTLSLINGLVLRALGLESPQAEAMRFIRDLPRPQFMLVGVAVAVAAPIAEELFFRGYVFRAYLLEKGPTVAYVGSAVIFAVLHGQLTLVLAIVSMGLLLAWLYHRSGTILAPMVAHSLNNGFAFLAQLALPAP